MQSFFPLKDHYTNPFMIGIVEDNKDPMFNYRVKVRLPILHNETISTEQLPWAVRIDSAFMGTGDEQDLKHSVPEIGSQVLILIMGGDANSLAYLGTVYKKTAVTPQDNKYLDTYGIYRKDGQFIGIDKIQKLFQLLFDGDININKIHNMTIQVETNTTLICPTTDIKGNVNITGNVEVTGNIHATGTIDSDTEVGAKSTVYLTTHTHTGETTKCTAPGSPWEGSTDPGTG